MDRLTAGQLLGRVDALLPNQYSRAEKMQWLAQAEGFVLREVRQAEGALPEVTEGYVLTAAPAHRFSISCMPPMTLPARRSSPRNRSAVTRCWGGAVSLGKNIPPPP